MRELRFDGLSPDGTRLILAGKDGQKWSVVIDERIEAAVRRDRARIGQVEIEQAGMLRPREIQARIRSGQTAEDVAAASGLPIEHIRRFEGPVLTERAWVAQQAQATEVRRPGGDIELGDLVVRAAARRGRGRRPTSPGTPGAATTARGSSSPPSRCRRTRTWPPGPTTAAAAR